MELPGWFRQAMQKRIDDVAARIEYHPELRGIRKEEREALLQLFAGQDLAANRKFEYWEDRHHLKQGMVYERLYWQGIRDGVQLAAALLDRPDLSDEVVQPEGAAQAK